MTNKEALVAALQVSVDDNTLEKALLDNDITGSAVYDKTKAADIDLCAINVLQSILATADVSEGGYSVRYDRTAIQARLQYLARLRGVTDMLNNMNPSVKAVSPW